MVLFMIINLLSGVNPSVVRADETKTWGFDNNGNTAGNKQVRLVETGLKETYQDGKFNVKLEVEGSIETIANNKKLDVVLVVDRSGSMKEENRMENAKTAAKSFVDKLLDGGNGKVRIGLVSYAGVKKDKYRNKVPELTTTVLQDNSSNLNSIINGYNAYSGKTAGTFTQAALREANKLFENNDNEKIIVLISDGLPTYSYNNKTKPDYKQIQKANKNEYKEGYEIWSVPVNENGKLDTKEWKKGYRTDSYETGLFLTTKWTYVPYYVKLIPVIEGTGEETSANDKARTIVEAKNIKDKGVRIFSVGIGVDNEGEGLLRNVASQGHYSDANGSASDLGKLLNEIADQLKFAVSNADLELVMNDKVEFKNANDLKKIEVKVINNKTNSEITSKSNAIKNSAKWNEISKTLVFSGITLDKDEVLNIKYNAELVETHKDGEFKPLNAKAVLYPKGKVAEPNSVLNFIIPNVKDMKTVNLTINKQWVGNKVPAGVDSVKFNIYKGSTALNEVEEVKASEGWTTTVKGLPRYKDGKAINYTVKEVAGVNYELKDSKKPVTDNKGNITFTEINKNTEKINFKVIKEWGNTPSELQFDTYVQLYKNDKKEREQVKLTANDKWETSFEGLPKYDEDGKEINYTVKEVNENDVVEAGEKITLKSYDYQVKHSNDGTKNEDIITNTVTNASNKTFTAKVTKKWEGGISTNDVIFTFTNKVDANKKRDLKITSNSFKGENTWTGEIQLPKYNDNDNSLAEYTVTEVAVPGFTTTGGENKVVTASDPNVEFTNKRITKNITVTKEWGATPEKFIDEVTVVLTGTADNYSKKESIKIAKGENKAAFTVPTHTLDGKEITYKATEQGEKDGEVLIGKNKFTVDYSKENTIVNTYTGLTTDSIKLKIIKQWDGEGRVPVDFEIIDENGNSATGQNITIDKAPWEAEVTLPKWDKATGNLKTYIVNEVKTTPTFALYPFNKEDDNKISEVDKTVTFINMRVMRVLTLEKEWIGEAAAQAKFKIEGGGVSKKITLTKNKDKKWKESVDLPVYDLEGNPIEYTINEEKIEGYKADLDTKEFNLVDYCHNPTNASVIFINTKMLDKKFTVYKNWDGTPANRVSFGLYDGGNQVDKLTLNSDKTLTPSYNEKAWTGTFTKELPEYKLVNGEVKKITYVVKELDENDNPVKDNKVILRGRTYNVDSNSAADNNTFNFTNTDITTGEITYTKVWKGAKFDEAKFGLFVKDGNVLVKARKGSDEIPAVYAGTDGNITFKDVDFAKYSAGDYVVRELDKEGNPVENTATIELNNTTPAGDSVVKKYQVTYDDSAKTITNTELIDITVKKTWADNAPQSEQQSVTVGVFYDGVQKEEVELNSNHSWTGKFENLPYVEGGYQVKETKINGINVDESLKKLYNINVENGTEIKTSGEVKVKNSFNIPKAEEGKIKVIKQWTVNPTKEITVKLYKKTVATPAAPSIWEEVEAKQLNNGSVFETEFTEPTDAEDYQILETAIGDLALTENEIQSILNSDDLDTIQYKIVDYEVNIQALDNDVFFIKNTNDNLLTEVTATKQWSAKTIEKNKKPVKVQLFADTNGVLEAIGSPVELNSGNQWSTKFKGLDRFDGEIEIKYYVAEVGTEKTNITLDDMTKGYKLGNSNVTITGDAKLGFVITNDVNLIDVTAEKVWENGATAVPVKFTLYRRLDSELTEVASKTLDGTQGWTAIFEDQPRVDEETGEDYDYYVFETEVNNIPVGIDPLTGAGYEVDPLAEVITYTTGDINNGRYSVAIHGNAANGEKITVKNTFKPNVVPVIPGGDTPGGIPVIPVVTPDPLPTPTPNPSTPVVDVPNDPSPQGPATPVNDGDEDNGVTEIDEDDVPQGDGKEVKKDNKANKDTVDITDNKAPKGTANLPKTGGETGDFLSIIGLGLIGLGLVIRRRR